MEARVSRVGKIDLWDNSFSVIQTLVYILKHGKSCLGWTLSCMIMVIDVGGAVALDYTPQGCLNDGEIELAQLINEYRQENNLAPIPISATLTEVAQYHVEDFRYAVAGGYYGADPACNLHTWYGMPAAPYGSCCYTSDHAQASCMWAKPNEISAGNYPASGFEIAASGYSTPASALNGWKSSSGHNNVILNQDIWTNYPWQAMGIGTNVDLQEGTRFYFVWFATTLDPQSAAPCSADQTPPVVTAPDTISLAATTIDGVPATENAIVAFLASATATDNIDGPVSPVNNNAPFTFPRGETTVTFSATDRAGNLGTAQSTVTVTYTPELSHAIKVLKILAGESSDTASLIDLNNDGEIGMAEALYVLQALTQ